MDWVADLASLPAVVAILVVFTVCVVAVIRYVSKHVVSPFKMLIGNHLDHLIEEQKEDRRERRKMRESLDNQASEFQRLCERMNGKGSGKA